VVENGAQTDVGNTIVIFATEVAILNIAVVVREIRNSTIILILPDDFLHSQNINLKRNLLRSLYSLFCFFYSDVKYIKIDNIYIGSIVTMHTIIS